MSGKGKTDMDTQKSKTNKIVGRICVILEGKLESPLLIGSGENQRTDYDMFLSASGQPMIPGSALAGAMRSFLSQHSKSAVVEELFGSDRQVWRKEQSPKDCSIMEFQSRIYVYDTILYDTHRNSRDGVRLNEIKTAQNSSKYEIEMVERGASFRIRLEVIQRENHLDSKMEEGKRLETKWKQDLECLYQIAKGMNTGELRIGAKSTKGFGMISIRSIKRKKFNMTSVKEYEEWLDWDWDQDNVFEEDELWKTVECNSQFHTLVVPLQLKGTLLIRQYGALVGTRQEGNRPVIPGSTWAGAIRSRIASILTQVWDFESWAAAQQYLEIFFGTWKPEEKENTKEQKLHASQILFEESLLEDGKEFLLTRNAIDRFTGGTVLRGLFTEKPWVEGRTKLVIRIKDKLEPRNHSLEGDNTTPIREETPIYQWEAACGLILWAVKDLLEGLLAFGGETAVGRGIWEASGEMKLDGETLKKLDEFYLAAAKWALDVRRISHEDVC